MSQWNGSQLWDILTLALAGASGGLVRSLNNQSKLLTIASDVLVGAILAIYLGPIAARILSPVLAALGVEESSRELGGFVCGVAGMVIVEFINALVAKKKRDLTEDDK